MKKRKLLILGGLISLFLSSLAFINSYSVVASRVLEIEEAEVKLIEARDLLYNNSGNANAVEQIKEKLNTSQEIFWAMDDGADKYSKLAKVEYVLIGYEQISGGEDQEARQEKRINTTKDLAEKVVDYDSQSSTANWILGDIYIALTNYVGTFKQVIYARRAVNYLQKAIELDSQNYDAYESLGSYYLFAPRMVGGNSERGVELLKKSLDSADRFINYQANLSLSIFYEEEEELDKAVKYAEQALEAYPRNSNIQKRLANLRNKLD